MGTRILSNFGLTLDASDHFRPSLVDCCWLPGDVVRLLTVVEFWTVTTHVVLG